MPNKTPEQIKEEKIIQDMADAMRRYGPGCTSKDLSEHFTTNEIEVYNERARMLANDLSVVERRQRAA